MKLWAVALLFMGEDGEAHTNVGWTVAENEGDAVSVVSKANAQVGHRWVRINGAAIEVPREAMEMVLKDE